LNIGLVNFLTPKEASTKGVYKGRGRRQNEGGFDQGIVRTSKDDKALGEAKAAIGERTLSQLGKHGK